jgi:hypothetical protein
MADQFGGVPVSPAADQFGGIPVDAEQPSALSRFGTGAASVLHGLAEAFPNALESIGNPGRIGYNTGMAAGRAAGEGANPAEALVEALPAVGPVASDVRHKNYAGALGQIAAMGALSLAPQAADALPDLETAGAAARAGFSAGAPDVAAGAGKLAAGQAIAGAMGEGGLIPRLVLSYPGARQIVRGVRQGVGAARDVFNDPTAANVEYAGETEPGATLAPPASSRGAEARRDTGPVAAPKNAAPAGTGYTAPAGTPTGTDQFGGLLVDTAPAPPPAPPRSGPVDQGYSAPAGTPSVADQLRAEAAARAPANGSSAPPAAPPAPPAPPAPLLDEDAELTALRDGIAQGYGKKSFAKLSAAEQKTVAGLAAKIHAQSAQPPDPTELAGPMGGRAPATGPQGNTQPAVYGEMPRNGAQAPTAQPPSQNGVQASPAPGNGAVATPPPEPTPSISVRTVMNEAANQGRPFQELLAQYRREGYQIQNDPFANTIRNRRGKIPYYAPTQ